MTKIEQTCRDRLADHAFNDWRVLEPYIEDDTADIMQAAHTLWSCGTNELGAHGAFVSDAKTALDRIYGAAQDRYITDHLEAEIAAFIAEITSNEVDAEADRRQAA